MKKFFLSILVVIALVIGTALVAPSFIDWNAYRAEIAAEIEKATGRAIAIDGAIDVALLPAPKLSLTKARLANLEGAAKPDMVRLEALELRISLMPLLSGKLVVQSVVLKGADIELEHLADGRENWKFKTARKGGSRGSGLGNGGGTGGDRVSLEQVVIENGTLTYRDSRKGTVKRISQINARIAAATLSGPIAARGRFHLGGVPVDFEFQAGRIVTGASTKISLETKFPDAKAKITYSGFVTPGTPSFTFSGKVSSAGPDL
ncbi:MAG: AsmA family protein, partial [Alphaproteobacteria bacterium]|nr:AsmA family protein [Alphaproteobacteria bacterium]